MRGHSRIPAGRVSAPLPNSSVRASPYLQEPSKPRWDSRDTTWGGCEGPRPAQSGEGQGGEGWRRG